jgi:hypothetical protein
MRLFSGAVILSTALMGVHSSAANAQVLGKLLHRNGKEGETVQTCASPAPAAAPAGYSTAEPPQVMMESELAQVSMEPAMITIDPNAGSVGTAGHSTTGMAIPGVQLVNSKHLIIAFDVKGTGPSGLGTVELWYTLNGQTWRKYAGGAQSQSPFVVDVADDGLYGFTVVAKNGVGLGKMPPVPGEPPQVWVEVDTARPEVHLLGTHAGIDATGRTLSLRWTATDKNLVSHPITLSYAERAEGPWMPFATNVENCGHYTWHMSPGLPNQVLLKIEATDRVGNIGADQTAMPAPVDLARPEATITGVTRNGVIQQTKGP